MSLKEILTNARAKIERPETWIKGDDARDAVGKVVTPNDAAACQFCAYGALLAGAIGHVGVSAAYGCLMALKPTSEMHDGLQDYNDDPATTHRDILDLFDKAIAAQ